MLAGSYKKQNDCILDWCFRNNPMWHGPYSPGRKQSKSDWPSTSNCGRNRMSQRWMSLAGTSNLQGQIGMLLSPACVLNQIVFLLRFCCYIRAKDSAEGWFINQHGSSRRLTAWRTSMFSSWKWWQVLLPQFETVDHFYFLLIKTASFFHQVNTTLRWMRGQSSWSRCWRSSCTRIMCPGLPTMTSPCCASHSPSSTRLTLFQLACPHVILLSETYGLLVNTQWAVGAEEVKMDQHRTSCGDCRCHASGHNSV